MGMNREHTATVDNWLLIITGTGHLRIEGLVHGHHRLPDGPKVTSRIVAFEKRDDRLVAVTLNTRYELLKPHPLFAALVPCFKERIHEGPVPGYYDMLLERRQ